VAYYIMTFLKKQNYFLTPCCNKTILSDVSGAVSAVKRESCESQERTRRCNRGWTSPIPLFSILVFYGKVWQVNRSGSQKTCLNVWSCCLRGWGQINKNEDKNGSHVR